MQFIFSLYFHLLITTGYWNVSDICLANGQQIPDNSQEFPLGRKDFSDWEGVVKLAPSTGEQYF